MLKDVLRHTHFPYCLDQLKDGRYVLLNRNYKPVGFMLDKFVTYEDYPVGVRIKGLTAKVAATIDCKGRDNTTRMYLYNDGCIPTDHPEDMKAYMDRLAIVMKLRIDDDQDDD